MPYVPNTRSFTSQRARTKYIGSVSTAHIDSFMSGNHQKSGSPLVAVPWYWKILTIKYESISASTVPCAMKYAKTGIVARITPAITHKTIFQSSFSC